MRIVETDNFGRDYPDESFLDIPVVDSVEVAQLIADSINAAFTGVDSSYPRYWRVVENNYQLQPGFEP